MSSPSEEFEVDDDETPENDHEGVELIHENMFDDYKVNSKQDMYDLSQLDETEYAALSLEDRKKVDEYLREKQKKSQMTKTRAEEFENLIRQVESRVGNISIPTKKKTDDTDESSSTTQTTGDSDNDQDFYDYEGTTLFSHLYLDTSIESIFGNSIHDYLQSLGLNLNQVLQINSGHQFRQTLKKQKLTKQQAKLEKTSIDQMILNKDVPERYFLRFGGHRPIPSQNELTDEAKWIYSQYFSNNPGGVLAQRQETVDSSQLAENVYQVYYDPYPLPQFQQAILPVIRTILALIRVEKLEIPFIWNYRADILGGHLQLSDLWHIYDLDLEYAKFMSKKHALLEKFTLKKFGVQTENLLKTYLRSTYTAQEVQDVREYFWHNHNQKNTNSVSVNAGLDVLARQIVLEPEQFGNNILGKTPHPPPPLGQLAQFQSPLEWACFYCSTEVRSQAKELLQAQKAYNQYMLDGLDSSLSMEHLKTSSQYQRLEAAKTRVKAVIKLKFGAPCAETLSMINNTPNFISDEPLEVFNNLSPERLDELGTHLLSALRNYIVRQLSFEPHIRSSIREVFLRRSFLSTYPTEKGKTTITGPYHPFANVKYLKDKPITRFPGCSYLAIHQAELQGLIEVKIHSDIQSLTGLIKRLMQLYCSNKHDGVSTAYDSFRRSVLNSLVSDVLFPIFSKEIRQRMKSDAVRVVLNHIKAKTVDIITSGPWIPPPGSNRPTEVALALQNGYSASQIRSFTPDRMATELTKVSPVYIKQATYSSYRVATILRPELNAPTFCTVVDPDGDLVESISLPYFILPENSTNKRGKISMAKLVDLKNQDMDKMVAFCKKTLPHVFCIQISGTWDREIYDLLRNVTQILSMSKDLDVGFQSIRVTFLSDKFAKLYSLSPRSKVDFPNQSPWVRQSIALARHLQNPMLALADSFRPWGKGAQYVSLKPRVSHVTEEVDGSETVFLQPGKEALYLDFHPYMNWLAKDPLYHQDIIQHVSRAFCETVGENGLDLNHCLSVRGGASILQFVPGLGPRRAKQLYNFAKSNDLYIAARRQMKEIFPDHVLTNSIGSFIIRGSGHLIPIVNAHFRKLMRKKNANHDKYFLEFGAFSSMVPLDSQEGLVLDHSLLDSTRIHPESYKYAVKMAYQCVKQGEISPQGSFIGTIMDNAQKLDFLDLKAYASALEAKNQGRHLSTLLLVKSELNDPFGSRLKKYADIGTIELFHSLTRTNVLNCYIGQIYECLVTKVVDNPSGDPHDQGVHIVISDTGTPIPGVIPMNSLTDFDIRHFDYRSQFFPGAVIKARLVHIDYGRILLGLSSRPSELIDNDSNRAYFMPQLFFDPYTNTSLKNAHQQEYEEKFSKVLTDATTTNGGYFRHSKLHKDWSDLPREEVEKSMIGQPFGTRVFRPSRRGPDHFTATLKITDDRFIHIDVREISEGDNTLFLIGHLKFHDIYQLIEQYLDPYLMYIKQLLNNRKFIPGDRDQVSSVLVDQKQKAISAGLHAQIPYGFGYDGKNQGHFLLYFLPGSTHIQKVCISCSASGYRLKGPLSQENFTSVDQMSTYFKKNWRHLMNRQV